MHHNRCIHIDICIPEGIEMSQVKFTASFSVSGQTEALAVTPDSKSFSLAVGTAVDETPFAKVTGGKLPYAYQLDPAATMPPGVDFMGDPDTGDISIAGIPTEAGTFDPVVLNITDADGAQVQFRGRASKVRK